MNDVSMCVCENMNDVFLFVHVCEFVCAIPGVCRDFQGNMYTRCVIRRNQMALYSRKNSIDRNLDKQ